MPATPRDQCDSTIRVPVTRAQAVHHIGDGRSGISGWAIARPVPEYPAALVREARGWLSDCQWADVGSDDIAGLADADVIRAIDAHWPGGWTAFRQQNAQLAEEQEQGDRT